MKKLSLIILGLLVVVMGVFTLIGLFEGPVLWYGIVQIVLGLVGAVVGFLKES